MSKHDATRRAFLKGAVAGAGSVASAGLLAEASAQNVEQHQDAHAGGPGLGAFFNAQDAATVAAFTERLMPGAPGKPGARDAGVLNYIDLALLQPGVVSFNEKDRLLPCLQYSIVGRRR